MRDYCCFHCIHVRSLTATDKCRYSIFTNIYENKYTNICSIGHLPQLISAHITCRLCSPNKLNNVFWPPFAPFPVNYFVRFHFILHHHCNGALCTFCGVHGNVTFISSSSQASALQFVSLGAQLLWISINS